MSVQAGHEKRAAASMKAEFEPHFGTDTNLGVGMGQWCAR
jgi:hypothetical protein